MVRDESAQMARHGISTDAGAPRVRRFAHVLEWNVLDGLKSERAARVSSPRGPS
ncbi:hypothetical protein BRPE64_BCDS11280 [Caballeronia insecticola]|uniref:Uncharacterized protein n=1 Tax=Caballeronia insecticola TaxID=758793 RepID=R4WMR4_9BURK|nr:hypothetical protein BRPE64_BCDS11280 [Caballeronia insecticola]